MIDFNYYSSLVFHFLGNHLLISFGIALVLAAFLYKKPEGTVKFLAFCVLAVATVYIMSLLGESGSQGAHDSKTLTTRSAEETLKMSR